MKKIIVIETVAELFELVEQGAKEMPGNMRERVPYISGTTLILDPGNKIVQLKLPDTCKHNIEVDRGKMDPEMILRAIAKEIGFKDLEIKQLESALINQKVH